MEQNEDLRLMVRCVQLFYGRQMQQRDIAEGLGVTPSRVSRLLKRAHEEGLYRVEFNFPALPEMAAKLADRYGLRDAMVIPTGEPSELKEDLGAAAARYFERVVGNNAKVGLSCGNTLFYLIRHLREGAPKALHIYPLAAEQNLEFVDILPNTLVGMMTAKYRPAAHGYALPAHLVSSSKKGVTQKLFLRHAELRKIYEEAQNVDVALVGIGGLDNQTPGFSALAAQKGLSLALLKKLGMVGEFNYQPFDADGQLLERTQLAPMLEHFIGVSLERMRELSHQHAKVVIGIGGGSEKSAAIRAALEGRLCNVLITDLLTAERLLSH